MSSDSAISVRGLTKEYRLGQGHARSALSEAVLRPLRSGPWRTAAAPFAALDDVSFDVSPGTALGVIGRNGAGKSTLLKVLSRITRPTAGEVALTGRVGSLLEVGTGFHPELTGRENVFMNGAMLGMRRSEILRKFDEIVAFAEVERFIDTPVKRYSSGMHVRLAFAVAAHLEPEILLIDEVLAVGDAEFQRKCLGKMGEVVGVGRTVLFVSHNSAAISQLTTEALLLDAGHLEFHGATTVALEQYLSVAGAALEDVDLVTMRRPYDSLGLLARLTRARLVGDSSGVYGFDERPVVEITYEVRDELACIRLAYTLFHFDGTPVGTAWAPTRPAPPMGSVVTERLTIEGPPLAPTSYYLAVGLGRGDERTGPLEYDIVMDTVHFQVTLPSTDGGTATAWNPAWGHLRLPDPDVLLIEPLEAGQRR